MIGAITSATLCDEDIHTRGRIAWAKTMSSSRRWRRTRRVHARAISSHCCVRACWAGHRSVFCRRFQKKKRGRIRDAIFHEIAAQSRVLLVARRDVREIGAVQLDLAQKPNSVHRAEVQKLPVLDSERNHGLGWRLMMAVESQARLLGRTLLVLDTWQGSAGDRLYRRWDSSRPAASRATRADRRKHGLRRPCFTSTWHSLTLNPRSPLRESRGCQLLRHSRNSRRLTKGSIA